MNRTALDVVEPSEGHAPLAVASRSGENLPVVDVEQESEHLHLWFVGEVSRGEPTTIEGTDDRRTTDKEAIVEVDGDGVGSTDAEGRSTVTEPTGEDSLEVGAEHELGEARIEFDVCGATPDPTETSEPTAVTDA